MTAQTEYEAANKEFDEIIKRRAAAAPAFIKGDFPEDAFNAILVEYAAAEARFDAAFAAVSA